MVAITNFVLFAATAAASLIPRDFTTVQNDLTKINTDTTTLKNSIVNWDGTVNGGVAIQNNFNAVDKDIKQTTSDANATAVTTSAQSQTIIDYINNTLEPNVLATINALISKKAQFTSAGLKSTVVNDLNTLKTDEGALGTALVNKASSDKKSAAQTAQNKVAADIQKGISAYAS